MTVFRSQPPVGLKKSCVERFYNGERGSKHEHQPYFSYPFSSRHETLERIKKFPVIRWLQFTSVFFSEKILSTLNQLPKNTHGGGTNGCVRNTDTQSRRNVTVMY